MDFDIDALCRDGYVLFPTPQTISLSPEDTRNMRAAGIGMGGVNQDIRRDTVKWLDVQTCGPGIVGYIQGALDAIPLLNRMLYLGIHDFECHLTCYAAGAYYRRHMDNRHGHNRRVLTYISYLSSWCQGDGGELRLENGLTIPPRRGQSILFDSTRIEHEVLVCQKERMAITGWFVRER